MKKRRSLLQGIRTAALCWAVFGIVVSIVNAWSVGFGVQPQHARGNALRRPFSEAQQANELALWESITGTAIPERYETRRDKWVSVSSLARRSPSAAPGAAEYDILWIAESGYPKRSFVGHQWKTNVDVRLSDGSFDFYRGRGIRMRPELPGFALRADSIHS